ncbi:MAG TPA: SGNH/GDSL hydrolase family protein [Bryobacteraceae bacterium]|nr:SGNH/GDSL hydrolase family protein [Bryobacteraceae bacterium]
MRFLNVLAAILAGATSIAAQNEFYLKDGDSVVFYGDSITNQRLYTTFTEAYVLTRFPQLNVRFVHSGWSGDSVAGGIGGPIDKRLERDVIAYRPTVVTIMLGMNDAGYRVFDPALFESYRAGYEHIVKSLKTAAPKARITAIQPSPYDDVTRAPLFGGGGYNGVLLRYGAFVRELAARQGLAFADLNTSVVAALAKANETNPALAKDLIPDRVHPSAPIHFLMAEALLKAWNAPAVVSEVAIDAALPAVRDSVHTSISKLSREPVLAWTQLDRSLPMPLEPFPSEELLRFLLGVSDFTETLNRERVTVTGLSGGQRYTLKIDGQDVVTRTAEEWNAGVELGEIATPMSKQSMDVLQLIYRHNDLHWANWHMIQTSFETEKPPSMDRTMAAIDVLDAEVAKMAREKAQPKPHRYELRVMQ